MASQQDPPQAPLSQRKRRGLISPELMALVVPPLKVGTWTGAAGVLAGVGGAIARDTNPVASGFLSGVQWFTLGSTYWFSRTFAMRTWGNQDNMRPSDKTIISAIAGTTTGAVAGLLRGPSKILPAMAMWGVLGAGGQMIVNHSEASKTKPKAEGPGFWPRLNPLRKLTDDEYLEMMREKILKLDVEIALIDDRIAELRALEHKQLQENAANQQGQRGQ